MKCKKCDSTEIIKRKNYSHGKSSGGKVILSCKECGSSDIEIPRVFGRRR